MTDDDAHASPMPIHAFYDPSQRGALDIGHNGLLLD